ncbi:hypothetical protein Agub_g11060, partial [Astrephomene gubernaculifera]
RAEALQLLLELRGCPASRAARWGEVAGALLRRPLDPRGVLRVLALTEEEKREFRALLDSKDLYGSADQRTLRHLLLRLEPPAAVQQLTRGSRGSALEGLIVEKMVPQTAPEGSAWRKTRISSPCDPQGPWPHTCITAAAASAAAASAAAVNTNTSAASSSGASGMKPADVDMDAVQIASQPQPPTVSYDVKYWYEVQRLHWHAKLGNLVLLPATIASAAAATAEYDSKAGLWRRAGVAAALPGFTGPLLDERGRYGRFKFSYEECRQRHADMLARLIEVFEL